MYLFDNCTDISRNKSQLFCLASSVYHSDNSKYLEYLSYKNEKMLLFWPVSYNDPETLGFAVCVTCSLCLLLLFRSLKQHFPALCFYTQRCLFLVTFILWLLCPSWLSLQSFTDFQLCFLVLGAHFYMQRRNWTGSYWIQGCLLAPLNSNRGETAFLSFHLESMGSKNQPKKPQNPNKKHQPIKNPKPQTIWPIKN